MTAFIIAGIGLLIVFLIHELYLKKRALTEFIWGMLVFCCGISIAVFDSINFYVYCCSYMLMGFGLFLASQPVKDYLKEYPIAGYLAAGVMHTLSLLLLFYSAASLQNVIN